MSITAEEYIKYHSYFLDNPEFIIEQERKYMRYLVNVTRDAASGLYTDFCRATDLIPFWIHYPPKQRGRTPTGLSIPWSEVGEKSLSFNLLRAILESDISVSFPGLPFGGDVRFATEDAFIHFDIKLTGPNDRVDEVVAPPQQISGDGTLWGENGIVGMSNNGYLVAGRRAQMKFFPKLPPFYVIDRIPRLCLTYFLKAVYTVEQGGSQPLDSLEIVCVPNGLLLFKGPQYADTPGLLIPGKDDKSKPEGDRRTRVRLEPLATLDQGMRCQKIIRVNGEWKVVPRADLTKFNYNVEI